MKTAAALFFLLAAAAAALAQQPVEACGAILKAAKFFHEQVGHQGGYQWFYSGDLKLCEAEGTLPRTTASVQPPGTPAIGEAFLDAWLAVREPALLGYAKTCAATLLKGQLHSGGWDHNIEMDDSKRQPHGYRDLPLPKKPASVTSLDDDISISALRFLMRLDAATEFKDAAIGEAVRHGLKSIIAAQYPNGAWYQWWKEAPQPGSQTADPALRASYPKEWGRKWLNDWTGRFFLNDNVAVNTIDLLRLAHQIYRDDTWLAAAKKGGDFLLLAQMPDPQPAWAQQYDPQMHPVWDRKFEPPSISSRESERVLLGLIRLFHTTGDAKYLEPHQKAIPYLKSSQMPGGKIARFLELQTNKPLYFEKQGKAYLLTYDSSKLPKHYGFIVDSILPFVEQEHQAALKGRDAARAWISEPPAVQPPTVAEIIASLDSRGAWIEKGRLDFHEVEPPSGIISCATFIRNMKALASAMRP